MSRAATRELTQGIFHKLKETSTQAVLAPNVRGKD